MSAEEEFEGPFCSCGHPIGTQQGQCPFLADDAGRVTLTPWKAPDPLPATKRSGIELVTTVGLWLLLLFGAVALGVLLRYLVTGS